MNNQKPKFRISYIVTLLVIVLLLCLIFIPSGYNGELLTGGKEEVLQLVDGTYKHSAEQENTEQMVAFYYKDGVAYISSKIVHSQTTQIIISIMTSILTLL